MQKVLVTGLGIGKKMEMCDACNLDFSWLFFNASTLLWVDKICLPKDLFHLSIKNPHEKKDVAVSIMLNALMENNLIELINDDEFEMQPFAIEKFQKQIQNDIMEMGSLFPDNVIIKKIENHDYNNIQINGFDFCFPYISSIYASLFIAESVDAHCLFNKHTYAFLKYKFQLDHQRNSQKLVSNIYDDIFSFALPNEIKPPVYAIERDTHCDDCSRKIECSNNLEKQTLEYIGNILSIRNYDELFQLRAEIEKIISQFISKGEDITTKAVKAELQIRQQHINSIIHRRFEQVKRWSKFASVCSVPVTIASAAIGNIPLTIASAAMTGLSQSAEKLMEIYESKKKWAGFLHLL